MRVGQCENLWNWRGKILAVLLIGAITIGVAALASPRGRLNARKGKVVNVGGGVLVSAPRVEEPPEEDLKAGKIRLVPPHEGWFLEQSGSIVPVSGQCVKIPVQTSQGEVILEVLVLRHAGGTSVASRPGSGTPPHYRFWTWEPGV